ncbi:MAG: ABC transporter substrate-binding protein [Pseudomonadota bacterium]
MIRLAVLLGLFLASGCVPAPISTPENSIPTRIVSLDYCADQYVLQLAKRDHILAVSPDATKSFSYMRTQAEGLPSVRSTAEDVIALKPDLVVRAFGGGPQAISFFERAGIPVLNIGWATSIDGEAPDSIPNIIAHVADGLGEPARGEAVITAFNARLGNARVHSDGKTILYVTSGGATTGPGSLVHELFETVGLKNFETDPGWRSLPLERLAYDQPDLVASAFFDVKDSPRGAWSAAGHPVSRSLMASTPAVPLKGAWTACGGWFVIDAIEALSNGALP